MRLKMAIQILIYYLFKLSINARDLEYNTTTELALFSLSSILISVVYFACLQYSSGAHIVLNLPEGSKCAFDIYNGTCVKDYKCLSMLKSIKERKLPPVCSYDMDTPIICCTDCYNDPTWDVRKAVYIRAAGLLFRTGPKAHDKCIDYLMEYPYECKDHNSYFFDFQWTEEYQCTSLIKTGIAPMGGESAVRGEFPHMALLGYGSINESLQWQCGGSLISDRYILTAGHCISSVRIGPVTYVALGILKRSDPPELWRLYKVKRIIPHPEYHSPSKYHDIALLETETTVKIDTLVLPACLNTEHFEINTYLEATGWGDLGKRQPLADTLQKVLLERFEHDECARIYQVHRHLTRGYDNITQLCYGDHDEAKDTCFGDSGGPLHDEVNEGCQFKIFGVTSSGMPCGTPGGAGLYTKVDYYIPWIESIVWPEN